MINLNKLSTENLEKIQKVLKIVLDYLEFGVNRLTSFIKIPFKKFEKENIFYEEVVSIFNKINEEGEKPIFEVLNESLEYENLSSELEPLRGLEEFESVRTGSVFLGISKKDLKENIILKIENLDNLDRLKEIKKGVDKKIKERAKTRGKEVRRQFEELDEKQKEKEELKKEIIEEVGKKFPQKKRGQTKETALYLNQNGDLYRKPRDKYCYSMGEKSNRHKIIRFLVVNKGYQLTEFISTELGIESEKTIRTEIGKIRNNIEKYLKIDGKDFLQSKKESGYKVNPKYKVILKNE